MAFKRWLSKGDKCKDKNSQDLHSIRTGENALQHKSGCNGSHANGTKDGYIASDGEIQGRFARLDGNSFPGENGKSSSIYASSLQEYTSLSQQYVGELKHPIHEHFFPGLLADAPKLLPYGDGATKVFGIENFGNTCYCNSILQCLFNLSEFRISVLKHPRRNDPSSRRRKLDMFGMKPRVYSDSGMVNNGSSSCTRSSLTTHSNGNGKAITAEGGKIASRERTPSPTSKTPSRKGSLMFFKINSDSKKEKNADSESDVGKFNAKVRGLEIDEQVIDDSEENPVGAKTNGKTDLPTPGPSVFTAVNSVNESLPACSEEDANGLERIEQGGHKIIVGRPPNKYLLMQRSSASFPLSNPEGRNVSTSSSTSTSSSGTINYSTGASRQQHGLSSHISLYGPSIEQRKKNALATGPVLVIDHTLAPDYFPDGMEPNLYSALKDLFECIVESRSMIGVVSPIFFVEMLRKENVLFDRLMHQDAHEFLNFLMNALSESLQSKIDSIPELVPENFIQSLFQGTMTNSVKCLTCDNVTTSDEPFLDFAIPVNGNEEVNIQHMLSDFHPREMLSGANKFYCDSCSSLQEAERSVGLKQLPKILLLHLKRFKYSEKHQSNIKLFDKVYYPLQLSVCSTFDPTIRKNYELTGIVIHMGGGPQHGHYVSICKHELYGWLLFDDETVECVPEDAVLKFIGDVNDTTTAYVLFYKEIMSDSAAADLPLTDCNDNIDQLLRCDDWMRRRCSSSANSCNLLLEEVPEEKPNFNTPRRRMRLFSFKKLKD